MNAREHLHFGIYSTVILATGLYIGMIPNEPLEITKAVGGVLLGSLLPDVDHPKSRLGRLTQVVWRMNQLHKWIVYRLCHKRFKTTNYIFKHGGITHTVLINAWIFILSYYLNSFFLLGVSFGYMTHLYIDHITGNKLPMLWYPFFSR